MTWFVAFRVITLIRGESRESKIDRIDKALITQAGDQLKLIANFGNGVDNIDVEAAVSRLITVTNTPGVLTEDTADMTMTLILAVARRVTEGARVIGAEAPRLPNTSAIFFEGVPGEALLIHRQEPPEDVRRDGAEHLLPLRRAPIRRVRAIRP